MSKSNYLYLGIAASFITLAIVQLTMPGLLPMSLYLYIAWVSLELTAFELLKSLAYLLKAYHQKMISTTQDEIEICDQAIETFAHFNALKSEYEGNKSFHQELASQIETLKNDKKIKRLDKTMNIITILQVVMCFVSFSISYVKIVPNDLITNKIVSILSLLSFAFLMLSFYFSRTGDEILNNSNETIHTSNVINKYYLHLFQKITKEKADTN